jgi:hypothetical protein
MAENKKTPEQVKDEAARADERLVKVRVFKAIAFSGVVVRPKVDSKSGKVTPVEAYIPRNVAKAHPEQRLVIIGDAPDGAAVGVIAKGDK